MSSCIVILDKKDYYSPKSISNPASLIRILKWVPFIHITHFYHFELTCWREAGDKACRRGSILGIQSLQPCTFTKWTATNNTTPLHFINNLASYKNFKNYLYMKIGYIFAFSKFLFHISKKRFYKKTTLCIAALFNSSFPVIKHLKPFLYYIHIYTHTHTHTHIYIYIYIYIYIF